MISTQSGSWFDPCRCREKQTQAWRIRFDTDALAALAAPPMSHCSAPLRIMVHDALDVNVVLIVDYYGKVRDHYGAAQLAQTDARGVGRAPSQKELAEWCQGRRRRRGCRAAPDTGRCARGHARTSGD